MKAESIAISDIVDSIKLERGILLRYTAAQLGFSGEEVDNPKFLSSISR